MEFNELESLRLFSVPDLSELPLLACQSPESQSLTGYAKGKD